MTELSNHTSCLSTNSNTNCQKYPPNPKIRMQLTFTCNHEPSILDNTFIKSAPLKSILLNYSIWWFIHSFRKKLARRNDAQIPKYVCQVLNLFIKGYPVNSFSSLHQLVHQKPCHRIQGSRPNTRRCLALYLQFTGPNFCCFNLALNYISSQFHISQIRQWYVCPSLLSTCTYILYIMRKLYF